MEIGGEKCKKQGLQWRAGKTRLSTLFERPPETAGGINNGSPQPKQTVLRAIYGS
jgi:hypothetical protein